MQPVDTLFEVGHHFDATGFSCLYNSTFGNIPERQTFLFIRDASGSIVGSIFDSAERLYAAVR